MGAARAERRRRGLRPLSSGWAPLAGVAMVGVLTALDVAWGAEHVVIGTVVIAPFVTALRGGPRETVLVAALAVVVCGLSASWNDNFGDRAYIVRLVVVLGGGAIAVNGARSRRRLFRDQRRFELLSAAAGISDVALGVEHTVQRISELLVPALADICVIDVIRDHDVERLAVAACGPRAEEIETGLRRRSLRTDRAAAADAVTAMRSGRALLIERATDEVVRRVAHDEGDLEFLRSLRGRSSMVVPLRARGRSIGSMTVIVTDSSGRRYDRGDLAFAQVLAGRFALALDNAGLFFEVESLEAQQAAALGGLAAAVTIQDARGGLVYANDAAARALGFDSAAGLLATAPGEIVDAFESFNEDGSPLLPEQLPGRRVLAGETTPPPLTVRAINQVSGEERWRVVHASAVTDPEGRPRLAVNVFEDVTEVKRAEVAQRFLASAGALLASSLDYEQTLAQVARLAVPELADWCGVTMPDDHGELRSVAVAHVDPDKVRFARDYSQRYPARLTDRDGVAQVMRDGVTQVVNDIPDALLEQAIGNPEQLAALRSIGMRAVMLVPMVTAAGVIGTISFVSAESGRTFSPADQALAEDLGRRAGTAVENARLYTERSRVAQTLQASLLPDDLPDIPDFTLASLYRPAGEETFVGGDFFDAVETHSGWMVFIGDVTGKGVHAAALTAQARHTLRSVGRALADPAAAVRELNASLISPHDLSLCTAAVALLTPHADGCVATLICAGHPQPLLIRDGRATPVGVCGPLIGAWEDSTWPIATVELRPGDVLVLYTDGVTDTTGDGQRFGDDRLTQALTGATDAHDAVAKVAAALEHFEHGAQADDTAILTLQYQPAPARTDNHGPRVQAAEASTTPDRRPTMARPG